MSADLADPRTPDMGAERAVLAACMASPEVTLRVFERLADPTDFVDPRHQVMFWALADLAVTGRPTDPISLRDHLDGRGELRDAGGPLYLLDVNGALIAVAQAEHHADIVAARAERRRALMGVERAVQSLHNPAVDTATALERLAGDLDRARRPASARGLNASGVELGKFLDATPPDPDWLIPGLLERQDRTIVTGPEGGGKSTLLRQLGVQMASGIHPFGGDPFPPVRVLILDLENSARQVYPKLHALRAAAGDRYAGGLVVAVRGEGLDLANGDGAVLVTEVENAKPDVLITGPAYKMVAGDPTEEGPARLVADHLDKIRMRYGCAVILEAHSPHASNGGRRPTRPYGASLWLRWPEFGLHLGEGGELTHWRGPREERDWPAMLQRGGTWPWTPVTRPRDVLWGRILDRCQQAGEQLAERDLATMLGVSKTSIHRAITEHAAEWEALGRSDAA